MRCARGVCDKRSYFRSYCNTVVAFPGPGLMCRASNNVRFHHQSLSDVLADHVAGDLAQDVPAQVQEPSAPAQSQGRVQGCAVRTRRRLLRRNIVSYRRLSPWPDNATPDAAVGRKSVAVVVVVVSEKEPQQETADVNQIKVHGPVGHICPDGGRSCARKLSPRVKVHGKAGWSKTGSFMISIFNIVIDLLQYPWRYIYIVYKPFLVRCARVPF